MSKERPRLVQSVSQKCRLLLSGCTYSQCTYLIEKKWSIVIDRSLSIVQTLSKKCPKLVQKLHQYALSQYNN